MGKVFNLMGVNTNVEVDNILNKKKNIPENAVFERLGFYAQRNFNNDGTTFEGMTQMNVGECALWVGDNSRFGMVNETADQRGALRVNFNEKVRFIGGYWNAFIWVQRQQDQGSGNVPVRCRAWVSGKWGEVSSTKMQKAYATGNPGDSNFHEWDEQIDEVPHLFAGTTSAFDNNGLPVVGEVVDSVQIGFVFSVTNHSSYFVGGPASRQTFREGFSQVLGLPQNRGYLVGLTSWNQPVMLFEKEPFSSGLQGL